MVGGPTEERSWLLIIEPLFMCAFASQTFGVYAMFERTCICGKDYGNNCAHYLANWMIMHGQLDPNPPGAYCCDAGRPLRAKEMRTIFSNTLRLNMHHNAPPGYSYIYCERVADHQVQAMA